MSAKIMSAPHVSATAFNKAIEELREYVAIPSVSNPNGSDYKMESLVKAAEFAITRLKKLGFEAEGVSVKNSAPFVIGGRHVDDKKPTIYAHYDVQPVDRKDWKSDPFKLDDRDGRLYGRGSSDDKGGIIAILTALETLQSENNELPVNVKVLFEGEEEYGSSNMREILELQAKRLDAQALVVLDGLNKDKDSGTLTSSTRGIVNIKLNVHALKEPVHSGVACLAPEPAQALSKLISSLENPKLIPGFMDGFKPMNEAERKILKDSSQTPESYAKENGVLDGLNLRGDPNESIYERIVEEPSLSIVNMNCGQPDGGNSIQAHASCTIGIRVLPGQNPDKVAEAVMNYIKEQKVMYNCKVDMKQETGCFAWKANLSGKYSTKYLQALAENFKASCAMPCGGALPLLKEFEEVFPKAEIMIPALEDPGCAAHGNNESLDKNIFKNAINSLISFLVKAGED